MALVTGHRLARPHRAAEEFIDTLACQLGERIQETLSDYVSPAHDAPVKVIGHVVNEVGAPHDCDDHRRVHEHREELRLLDLDLLAQPAELQLRIDSREQFARRKRLGQVVVRPRGESLHHGLFPSTGRQHDDRNAAGASVGAQRTKQTETIQPGIMTSVMIRSGGRSRAAASAPLAVLYGFDRPVPPRAACVHSRAYRRCRQRAESARGLQPSSIRCREPASRPAAPPHGGDIGG